MAKSWLHSVCRSITNSQSEPSLRLRRFHPAAPSAPAAQVQNAIRRSDAEDAGGGARRGGLTGARRPALRVGVLAAVVVVGCGN